MPRSKSRFISQTESKFVSLLNQLIVCFDGCEKKKTLFMASLSVKQRKERLVQQFELMIQDEQKNEVLKTKQKVLSGEMKTTPLKDVQAKLDRKYGL